MIRVRTLLNLLAYTAALLGVVPLYAHLDRPVQAFLPVALLAGMFCDRIGRHPLRGWPVNLLSLVLFAAYALQVSRQNAVLPVVHILVLLLAIRLAAAKAGRHYLQIFLLAVFTLAGSTLLTLDPLFLPAMLLQVVCVTIGLVLLTFHAADPQLRFGRRQLRQLLGVSLFMPAVSLALMVLFFAILPRTRHPLWNFLNSPSETVSALAEQVRPGGFADQTASGAVVFRVETEELAAGDLYWRGTVLNVLEEDTWRRRSPSMAETVRAHGGKGVRQVFYPEHEGRQGAVLPVLDFPQALEGIWAGQAADLVHTLRRSHERRFRYQAVSRVGGSLQTVGPVNRSPYLQVSDQAGPRLQAVARQVAAEAGSDREKIARLEEFFRRQELTYATTDLPGAEAPLETFLFDKRRGYCEFFASSFAVLLRLSGVPARLVGGYQGGEYNSLGGYYVVAENSAHIWVEALVDGREWVRIDPTTLARNAGRARAGLGPVRRILDAFDYWWTRTVIAYDLGRQLEILQGMDVELNQLRLPPPAQRNWILGPLAGILLLVLLWRRPPAEERLLGDFLRLVRQQYRLGLLPASMGLLELAVQTGDPLCRQFVDIYAGAIYRDRRLSGREKRDLRQLLKRLRNRDAGGRGV